MQRDTKNTPLTNICTQTLKQANTRYTFFQIGTRSGSCVRKASDPIPATVTAGRVAGLHLAFTHTTKFFSSPCVANLLGSHVQGMEIMKFQINIRQIAFRVAIAAAIGAFLVACGGGKSETFVKATPSPSAMLVTSQSSELCAFADDDEAAICQPGQVALFVPNSWGNEQLPIIYAAKYCDFNFPIVHTNGAVTCVFFKNRTIVKNEESSAPTSPAQSTAPNAK